MNETRHAYIKFLPFIRSELLSPAFIHAII
jgi:hypothetical protein